jgi:site-specific recombinase XerD
MLGVEPGFGRSAQGHERRFRDVHDVVSRVGAKAGLPFKAHPHMLRHAAGYKLANGGHDTRSLQAYLGHRNIQHTVRYTELAANRFSGFWK